MQMLQDPDQVAAMVGRDAKLRARRHRVGEEIEDRRADEASLVVSGLGPWIGKQDERAGEARRRQAAQQETGIVGVDPNIADVLVVESLDKLGHPVEKRLAPDIARVGVGARLFQ